MDTDARSEKISPFSMDICLVFNVILGLETVFPVDLAAALQETMGMLKSPRRIDSVVSMTRRYRRNDNECFIENSLLAGGEILLSVWSITPRIAKVNRDVIFLEHCTKIKIFSSKHYGKFGNFRKPICASCFFVV